MIQKFYNAFKLHLQHILCVFRGKFKKNGGEKKLAFSARSIKGTIPIPRHTQSDVTVALKKLLSVLHTSCSSHYLFSPK